MEFSHIIMELWKMYQVPLASFHIIIEVKESIQVAGIVSNFFMVDYEAVPDGKYSNVSKLL